VLSLAVLWVTVKLKFQSVYDRIYPESQMQGIGQGGDNPFAIIDAGDGVKYQDLAQEKGEASSAVLGELVSLKAKAFYNGLQLFTGTITYRFGMDETSAVAAIFPSYLAGITLAMKDVKVGGKRQISLPCEDGFEPYVPRGGVILCVVALDKPFAP